MRRLPWIALLAACLAGRSPLAAADRLPDVNTLRARIVAARGAAPENYRDTVTLTAEDGTTATFRTYKRGANVRTTEDAGPIHTESGTSDGENWHQNANGITVIEEPEPAPRAPAAVPTVTSANGALVISDLDQNGFGLRQYVDPATYRIVREQLLRRSGTFTTTYDYARFGTQTLTAHWTTIDARTGAVRRYARVERTAGVVTAAQVAEPTTRRALVAFPANQAVTLPATFADGKVIVAVTIAGHALKFALDTGARGIVLDNRAATALGLTPHEYYTATTAQSPEFAAAVVPALTAGRLGMRDVVVATAPLTGRNVDGLLGFDFLATIGVRIDYEHQTVTAIPAAAYVPPAGPNVAPVDVRLGGQIPMLAVGIDGVPAERFVIDTGADGSFTVFASFMDRHPKLEERSSMRVNTAGTDDDATLRTFTHSLRLGAWTFADLSGYRVVDQSAAQSGDGTIGAAFLRLFDVDLDYPHGRIYLTPTEGTKRMLHLR